MKGLLLAGGHGTRLRPLTFTGNKHMLPIANKPMLYYGLKHLIEANIREIGIILGPIGEGVVNHFKDGSIYGVKITYIDQPEPKGLAHAIMVAQDFLADDSFVMYLGDNLLKQGVRPQIRQFKETNADFTGAVMEIEDPSPYGVVVMRDSVPVKVVEKPKELISNLALIGVYVFSKRVHQVLSQLKPSARGEYEITDTIQLLIDQGAKVNIQKVEGWWKDTGKPQDLLTANQLVLADLEPYNHGKIHKETQLNGKIAIGEGTIIYPKTRIDGPAIIGKNSNIGPEAYIGPSTAIGDGVTIKNSSIMNSIIMDGAHIDCQRNILDSLIGRNSEITKNGETYRGGVKFILGDQAKIQL
jgi:glucose-1-phosphate thymidylyltransferase